MEITYLLNSGFIVKLKRSLLVFDDFNDPARSVDEEIARECHKIHLQQRYKANGTGEGVSRRKSFLPKKIRRLFG